MNYSQIYLNPRMGSATPNVLKPL